MAWLRAICTSPGPAASQLPISGLSNDGKAGFGAEQVVELFGGDRGGPTGPCWISRRRGASSVLCRAAGCRRDRAGSATDSSGWSDESVPGEPIVDARLRHSPGTLPRPCAMVLLELRAAVADELAAVLDRDPGN